MLNLLILIRPRHWLKNLILLFPPFFAGIILNHSVLNIIPVAVASFSLAASGGYVVNDILDARSDLMHFDKKGRPFARGAISLSQAVLLSIILHMTALFLALFVSIKFTLYVALYFIISLLYSFYFKNIVIADILLLSFGYIIRLFAGGEAFGAWISSWLFLTVFMISLFLSASKRLGEVVQLGQKASEHRKCLEFYTYSFLEGIIWFSSTCAVVTYALYTIEHVPTIYTIPIAVFGLLRYIYVTKQGRSDPVEIILNDKQIIAAAIILFSFFVTVIYYE